MANVGFATLSVIPSFNGFQSRLSAGVATPLAAAGREGGRRYGDAAGREAGDRFKSGFGARLKGFAPLAGIAAGAGALSFFKSAIDEASSLSESGNKINTIFGDAAATVNSFADAASESIGQSDLQARNAAASFGVYGKAAGLAGDDLAAFSTDLTSLASDLASFYDTSVDEAIQAIGSGLRGEAEPLRAYGVLLDDATLRTEALRQGLIKTTKQALSPQQKVLAAQAVIMEQTAVAQGDFAKTSDGLANSTRDLQADLADMRAELGENLLPAATATVGFLKDDALPTLGAVGGAAKDLAEGFGDLPAPVQAATAAFVALRIASATGISAAVGTGVARTSSAIQDLRLRTMLAADAFRQARTTTLAFSGNVGTVERGVGRLSASMAGLRAGAAGAGTALKAGLSGVVGVLGGPWGIAIAAGTAAVAHFWSENQEAKQRVEDLTASLDSQTGALTENSRELVFNTLQKEGAISAARTLGIGLETLQAAAEGDTAALQRLSSAHQTFQSDMQAITSAGGKPTQMLIDQGSAWTTLNGVIGDSNGEIAQSRQNFQDHAEAMGESTDATRDTVSANDDAAGSFQSLRDRIRETKDEIKALADAEEKRRIANLKNRRDRLALVQQMQATAEEATNSEAVGDINERIREARERGREERADLQEQLRDAGSDIADLQKRLAQAKTKSERDSLRDQIANAQRSAAEQRGDISERIRESIEAEREAVADAQSELKEYTRTLDINSEAGQKNLESLYDLADQWNNSSKAVRNADGAYEELRQAFSKSAEQMGATRQQAKRLADDLLLLPKDKRINVSTPGMKEALEDLARLQERLEAARDLAVYVNTKQSKDPRLNIPGAATGGYITGSGTSTSDSILARLSNGEFVQRAAAVDYYGVEFMRRLNAMQIPKFAGGGPVSTVMREPTRTGGVDIIIDKLVAHDYQDFMLQAQQKAQVAALTGRR